MRPFGSPSWELILADLALILFVVTLSALAFEEDLNEQAEAIIAQAGGSRNAQVAPSQALFRPTNAGPSITEWLSARPRDDRATLTVFAQHSGPDREVMWRRANTLAQSASQSGFAVRVVITRGEISDLHASLAYDAPEASDKS